MEIDDKKLVLENKHSSSLFLSSRWIRVGMFFHLFGKKFLVPLILLASLGLWANNSLFSATAHNNAGASLYAKSRYDEALVELDKAIKMDPTLAAAYNNRGMAYYQLGDYNNALADSNQAIKLNPNDEKEYNNRGLVYYRMRDYNSAISDYDQAVQLSSSDVKALFNRALAYVALGDNSSAMADFSKVVELNTDTTLRQRAETYLTKLGSK